jgi:hypothetical protein
MAAEGFACAASTSRHRSISQPVAAEALLSDEGLFRNPTQAGSASWGAVPPVATLDQVRAELRLTAARIDQQQPPAQDDVGG